MIPSASSQTRSISDGSREEPSPWVIDLAGSFRESFQPLKAAMSWLKKLRFTLSS
ncbi:MAG: hypothetical protein VXX20_04925 [Verrucomicrobiota bacterium]|nr:hypothetical protein [Verrucomicrobiota bacterium]